MYGIGEHVVSVVTAAARGADGIEYIIHTGEMFPGDHPVVQASPSLFLNWPATKTEIAAYADGLDVEARNRNAGLLLKWSTPADLTFSTTTTDADPGSGNFRLSNGTQSSSVTIRLNAADLPSIAAGTRISLTGVVDPTHYLTFTAVSVAALSGYSNVTVTLFASSASSPFSNSDSVALAVTV